VRENIEYRFRVPNAAVFTLYSKTLEYALKYPLPTTLGRDRSVQGNVPALVSGDGRRSLQLQEGCVTLTNNHVDPILFFSRESTMLCFTIVLREQKKKRSTRDQKQRAGQDLAKSAQKLRTPPIIANHSKHEEAAAERSSQQDRRRKDRKRGVMGVRRQSM
jgi:hypothetical protein